ncbi:MAG: AsmA family protein, partial [Planctomycetota bacterium]
FSDWKGEPLWNGGLIYPEVPSILPFICRSFTPMGIADFELSLYEAPGGYDPVTKETKKDTTLGFKVFMRDVVTSYTGLPETDGDGFALPLHNAYGVVEGRQSPGQPDQYTVRGYTEEELASLGLRDTGDMAAHREGLVGTLTNESERVFVKVVYTAPDVGHDPSLTINIATEGLDFDEHILDRLPDNVQPIVRDFAPKGAVDIDRARISLNPEPEEGKDSELSIRFTLGSKALAGQYHFKGAPEPAKFKEVAGTIDIKANEDGEVSVKLTSIKGKIDNSNVSLGLSYADSEIPVYMFESDDFKVTPQLANVLSPEVGGMLTRFDVHGHIKLEISGQMLNEEPDFTDADVEFIAGSGERSGSIRFESFPYVLTNVHGLLFVSVRETYVEVFVRNIRGRASDVEGSVEESWIEISGHVLYPFDPATEVPEDDPPEEETPEEDSEPEGPTNYPQIDLHVRGAHIAVDEPILDALDTMMRDESGETSTVVSFIKGMAVEGGFGIDGRITIDDNNEFDWRFDVILEGVAVTPERFPMRVSDLFGTVVLDGTTVTLRDVTGRGESGELSLHEAGYSEEEGWFVTVAARGVVFEDSPEMEKALPGVLQKTMKKLTPKGVFDLDLHLSGKDDILRYNVSLDTWEVDLDIGLHFDDMTARFDFNGVLGDNYHRQNGSVFVESVFFKDARFDRIYSAVQLFDNRLEFPNLRGNFYSGWVEGRFGLVDDSYKGELSIRGADLKDLGLAAFPDSGEFAGVLDGEVRFQSDIDSNGTIGRGRFDVGPRDRKSKNPKDRECKLAPVPLFNNMFKVIGEEQNFDEGHLYFWLMPERMVIREMDFVSDAARVELFGSDEENFIMYDSKAMRMKLFFTIAPRTPIPLPGVQQILDLLKQVLFPLFVTGTMNDPNVQPFSLDAEELAALQDEFPRRPRGS